MINAKNPRVELGNPHGLLSVLLKYLVLPLPDKKKEKGQFGLERQLGHDKKLAPIEEIKQSIDSLIKRSFPEEEAEINAHLAKETSSLVTYSFSRKTMEKRNYSVSINYHSTDGEERMDITFDQEEESSTETIITKSSRRKEAKHYSFSILRPKAQIERRGYEVHASYEYFKGEEHAVVEYRAKGYAEQIISQKSDFSERVPFKVLHIRPKNMMGGILGYTFLGESYMALRDDLIGSLKKEVDIHESIHTPDEYETRVLTWWMMERPKMQYGK